MKILSLLLLSGCVKHIHNSDLLDVEVGMSYNEVVQEIGRPHRTFSAKIEHYAGTQILYNHEIFIYRANNEWLDSNGGRSDCYFVYADRVLRQFNCY
jgi:hypothetical protein